MEIKAVQCQGKKKKRDILRQRPSVNRYDKNWKPTELLVSKEYDIKNKTLVKNSGHWAQGHYHPSRDYLPGSPLHYDQKVGLDIFGTCTLDANMKPPTQSFGWKATHSKKLGGPGKIVWRPLCSRDWVGSASEQMGAAADDRGVERWVSALHASVGLGRMTWLEMYLAAKNSTQW